MHFKTKTSVLKQFFIILLSSILLLPSFGNTLIFVKFKINQDEIAKTICVQRKLAQNTCNGRCELLKSMKKFEDNEKKMHNDLKEKSDLVYIQNTSENNFKILASIVSVPKLFPSSNKKPISVSIATFHPPTYLI